MRPLATLTLALMVGTTGCAALGGPGAVRPVRTETGVASFYGNEYRGQPTASGARFDPRKLTAAHRTLPFGTRLRVTNLDNGRTAEVVVTDRGPFRRGRILDVSRRAAERLGFERQGEARVRIDVLPS